MAVEKKEINVVVPSHTLENGIAINPEQSLLPIILTGDRILIEPVIHEDDKFLSKESNIQKPVNAQEAFRKGRVVSIGGGEYGQTIPASLKVNMLVSYWHKQAIDFAVGGKTYDMVRSSDAFGYL